MSTGSNTRQGCSGHAACKSRMTETRLPVRLAEAGTARETTRPVQAFRRPLRKALREAGMCVSPQWMTWCTSRCTCSAQAHAVLPRGTPLASPLGGLGCCGTPAPHAIAARWAAPQCTKPLLFLRLPLPPGAARASGCMRCHANRGLRGAHRRERVATPPTLTPRFAARLCTGRVIVGASRRQTTGTARTRHVPGGVRRSSDRDGARPNEKASTVTGGSTTRRSRLRNGVAAHRGPRTTIGFASVCRARCSIRHDHTLHPPHLPLHPFRSQAFPGGVRRGGQPHPDCPHPDRPERTRGVAGCA
jgi:hypothetical protein